MIEFEDKALPSHSTFEEANELILRLGRAIQLTYLVTPVEEPPVTTPSQIAALAGYPAND